MLKLNFKRVTTALTLLASLGIGHNYLYAQNGATTVWSDARPSINTTGMDPRSFIHAPKKATDSFGNWISLSARMTTEGVSQSLEFTYSHDDAKTWSNAFSKINNDVPDSNPVNPDIEGSLSGEFLTVWEATVDDVPVLKSTYIYPIGPSFTNSFGLNFGYSQIALNDIDAVEEGEEKLGESHFPSIATDNLGTWLVAYRSDEESGSFVKVSRLVTALGMYTDPWQEIYSIPCSPDAKPKLTNSKRYNWHLAFEQVGDDDLTQIAVVSFNDNGLVFTSTGEETPVPVLIDKAVALYSDVTPDISADADGKILLAWSSITFNVATGKASWLPFYSFSKDFGKKWSYPMPVTDISNSSSQDASSVVLDAAAAPNPATDLSIDHDVYQNWIITWLNVKSDTNRQLNYVRFTTDNFLVPAETGIIPKPITSGQPGGQASTVSVAFPHIKASNTGTWVASYCPYAIVTPNADETKPPTVSMQFPGDSGTPYFSYVKYFTNHNSDLAVTGFTTSTLTSKYLTYYFQVQNRGDRRAYGVNLFIDNKDYTNRSEEIQNSIAPWLIYNILPSNGSAGGNQSVVIEVDPSASTYIRRWAYGTQAYVPYIEPGQQFTLAYTVPVTPEFEALVKDAPLNVIATVNSATFELTPTNNKTIVSFPPPPPSTDPNNPDNPGGPDDPDDPDDPDTPTTPTISLSWTGVKTKANWNEKKPEKLAKLQALVKVTNTSTTNTLTNVPVKFFLSNDATWSAGDTPLNTVTIKKLKPGKAKKLKAKGSAPGPVTGKYILTVFPDDRFFAQQL